ncbi:hypothetical protein KKB64_04040 [Patescibacteria group bacterium]|nr:hypothetical protein [Patescibacteria group bacterium]
MKTKEIILKATDGLVGSATNGVLWWLYLVGASVGKSNTSFGVYQAFREADQALHEFNYESFKQVLSRLQRNGLIKRKKLYSQLEIEITNIGKKKIEGFLVGYQSKRPWDCYLYLISYDLPEAKRILRDLLRDYLKHIGCALLQESLWLTPYNPRKLLNDFMDNHQISGTILVSKLGKDGTIGDDSLADLLDHVYQLKKLNERYKEFLDQAHLSKNKFQMAIKYQHVLDDDPQLPFELLPKDWLGDKSYQVMQRK